jgi:hypothetical protein
VYLSTVWKEPSSLSENKASHLFHVNPSNLIKNNIISTVRTPHRMAKVTTLKWRNLLLQSKLVATDSKLSDMNIRNFKHSIPKVSNCTHKPMILRKAFLLPSSAAPEICTA